MGGIRLGIGLLGFYVLLEITGYSSLIKMFYLRAKMYHLVDVKMYHLIVVRCIIFQRYQACETKGLLIELRTCWTEDSQRIQNLEVSIIQKPLII